MPTIAGTKSLRSPHILCFRRTVARVLCVVLCQLLLQSATFGESAAPVAEPTKADPKTLFDRVIELNRIQEPELDTKAARTAFNALVSRVREALPAARTPRDKVAVLNRILLADRKVAYLSNKYWRDATLAASLLRGKGNCLSTSTLYVLVGDALKLPVRMVIVPRHAYARWDEGKVRINIETTNGGREVPDSVYLDRGNATPEDIRALGWGRSLDQKGFLAELLLVAAGHRGGQNRLEDAMDLMEQAEKLVPGRSDIKLSRLQLMADITGRRSEAQKKIIAMLRSGRIPPTVSTNALMLLAQHAAAAGDFTRERKLLLGAFAAAPKSSQRGVLQELASCHRSLKDFRGAVRYMELAEALCPKDSPEYAAILYNLAIYQKNDNRLTGALASLRKARKINPESWNLKMIEAGYLVLNGQREEGLKRFAQIKRPRGDVEFYENMLAWFYSVSRQREKFYKQFKYALSIARTTRVIEWLDQDVDLDVYRNEPEFKALVEEHRKRLLGK